MQKHLMTLAIASLLGACATAPGTEPVKVAGTPKCHRAEMVTGSNIAKKQDCSEMTDEDYERARQAASDMRDDQMRRNMPKPGPGGI